MSGKSLICILQSLSSSAFNFSAHTQKALGGCDCLRDVSDVATAEGATSLIQQVPGTFYHAEITESHDYDVVARILE